MIEGHACDVSFESMLTLLCLVGLIITLFGYRLYVGYLAVFGFLIPFSLVGASGAMWVFQHPEQEDTKKVVVIALCFIWGCLGAIFCKKVHSTLQKFLAFWFGVTLGIELAGATVYLAWHTVDNALGAAYEGWVLFAFVTLSLPSAIQVGFLLRDSLKYAVVFSSGVGGASLAVISLEPIFFCSDDIEGKEIYSSEIQVLAMIIVAAIGITIQLHIERKTLINAIDQRY